MITLIFTDLPPRMPAYKPGSRGYHKRSPTRIMVPVNMGSDDESSGNGSVSDDRTCRPDHGMPEKAYLVRNAVHSYKSMS